MTAFELALQDRAGLAVAERVRPDRIELCAALSTGGITPSIGLIAAAVETGIPIHVLVRPRAGGFVYDAADTALILADVRAALAAGAAGVVVGGTTAARGIDTALTRAAVEAAADASGGRADVTFHRAFDVVADRRAALDELAGLGVTRVLTSGGASRAADALDELRALVAAAAGRIQILAGAGVDPSNAAAIAATGVEGVHASAKTLVTEELAVSMGSGAPAGRVSYEATDEAAAAAIRDIVRGAAGARP